MHTCFSKIDATDKLEEQVKEFFGSARKLRPVEREEVYQSMKREYFRVLEDAGMYQKIFSHR